MLREKTKQRRRRRWRRILIWIYFHILLLRFIILNVAFICRISLSHKTLEGLQWLWRHQIKKLFSALSLTWRDLKHFKPNQVGGSRKKTSSSHRCFYLSHISKTFSGGLSAKKASSCVLARSAFSTLRWYLITKSRWIREWKFGEWERGKKEKKKRKTAKWNFEVNFKTRSGEKKAEKAKSTFGAFVCTVFMQFLFLPLLRTSFFLPSAKAQEKPTLLFNKQNVLRHYSGVCKGKAKISVKEMQIVSLLVLCAISQQPRLPLGHLNYAHTETERGRKIGIFAV